MFQTMEKYHQKQKFTKKEDSQLIRLVKKFGTSKWEEISHHMERRTARQCRDRYNNYLSDNFKKGSWTENEDMLIISLYNKIGPHWLAISKSVPGRSGNDIKNRWHKTLIKKINEYDKISNNSDSTQTEKTEIETIIDKMKNVNNDNDKTTNQSNTKLNQLNDSKITKIFDFYETQDNQWNLFPNEEEKRLRFDI